MITPEKHFLSIVDAEKMETYSKKHIEKIPNQIFLKYNKKIY